MKIAKKHRAFLISAYNHLYEHHSSSRPGCFYCGDVASTIDHCPPLTFCDVKNLEWFREKKIKFYKVSSCVDCNKKLGNKALLTLQERADFLMKKLENKTDELVIWTDDEVAEMSEMFTKMIKARKEQNKILFDRTRFCQELIAKNDDFPEEGI